MPALLSALLLLSAARLSARHDERAERATQRNRGQRGSITFEREQQRGNTACGEKKGAEREVAIVVFHGWDRQLGRPPSGDSSKVGFRKNATCVTVR